MKSRVSSASLALLVMLPFLSSTPAQSSADQVPQEIITAAADAYVYAYPLVLMDITKKVMTATELPGDRRAPINQFAHVRTFPSPADTDVVSPNADTLYSVAWLDLSKEPVILSIPDMNDRYFLMPILDAWTNVIASPGKRTTGTHAQNIAIVGRDFQGDLPQGVSEVRSPTDSVWIVGRILTSGPEDFAAVNQLQDQMKLTLLSQWGMDAQPVVPVSVDPGIDTRTPPVEQVARMDAAMFFKTVAHLLIDQPTLSFDQDMSQKLQRIGIRSGAEFNLLALDAQTIKSIKEGFTLGRETLMESVNKVADSKYVNGWALSYALGSYGTEYMKRATIALVGLGANLSADAFYPMTRVDSLDRPLSGTHKYVLHFTKQQLPAVNGFWSMTMYNSQQFFVENPIQRYAIGDRNDLQYNEDGSLDIYVQHESPGAALESNWLPAPEGEFNLIMRLYWPKESVLDGSWVPPAMERVERDH